MRANGRAGASRELKDWKRGFRVSKEREPELRSMGRTAAAKARLRLRRSLREERWRMRELER